MSTAIVVFAKAPVAGYAKTRLIPALGAQGAADLAERLMHAALTRAVAARLGPVELCVAPDRAHRAFGDAVLRHGVALTEQGDGDLGERMARAFERVLRTQPQVLLLGTDAPGLDAAYLRGAALALRDADAVFGPAADGGYTLVGLKQPRAELFTHMRWSHDRVMAHTRERLAQANLRHVELPVLHDVDEPDDLTHLAAHGIHLDSTMEPSR
jgi:rSAM/selenodomain-associated transferase 1